MNRGKLIVKLALETKLDEGTIIDEVNKSCSKLYENIKTDTENTVVDELQSESSSSCIYNSLDNKQNSFYNGLQLEETTESETQQFYYGKSVLIIKVFQEYLQECADIAFKNLNNSLDVETNYKLLTECVLALVVMFNRKRIDDVQYLKVCTYTKEQVDNHDFFETLSEIEKIVCKSFKKVISGGKGSKPVPILFSKQVQKYIECLLNIRKRTDLIPTANPYLFANVGSEERWIAGVNVIRKLVRRSGAKRVDLLTSTKFRKHIATTLQLMTMDEGELEQLATFMGHTRKTHTEFYRLPQDVYQTSKVAKILVLLEKGKGNMFKGKKLHEIELENNVYYSSGDSESNSKSPLGNRNLLINSTDTASTSSSITALSSCLELSVPETKSAELGNSTSRTGRIKWSKLEKKIVLQ